jgi:hypothetical protein
MSDFAPGLRSESQILAQGIDSLGERGTAAVFGVCGRALTVLVRQVEQRSGGRWEFVDLAPALDQVEAFATGSAEAQDHSHLRERLMAVEAPDGHPWSTFVQDAVICADAGLAAASIGDRPRSTWIQYALEPLRAVLENRDRDFIRTHGIGYWEHEVLSDPTMTVALDFLREMIAEISRIDSVDHGRFDQLVRGAAILLPSEIS